MTAMQKRIAAFTATFGFITLLFWAGGFDFNERGFLMADWLLLATSFGAVVAACPIFEDKQ